MVSTQSGAAIAKTLFPALGAEGVVLLRLGFAAAVVVGWAQLDRLRLGQRGFSRPRYSRSDGMLLLGFGVALALMNGLFYGAIARIPIGVAVTLEFCGPLGVALLRSRSRWDWLWAGLALLGIGLLSPRPGTLLDPLGIGMALGAGVGWGSYILLSARLGKRFPEPMALRQALGWAMAIAALLLLPLGVYRGGWALLEPRSLVLGFGVAILGSVVTYSLEIAALKRLPVAVFGVLMSLEPAIATLIAGVTLGERLSTQAIAALVAISCAAAGTSLRSARSPTSRPPN